MEWFFVELSTIFAFVTLRQSQDGPLHTEILFLAYNIEGNDWFL